MRKIFFLGFTLLMLQGCTNAAMTGAQAVYNRHSITKKFNDQYITMQAYKAIQIDSDDFKNANVVISTYGGEVLLTGQAPTNWQRQEAAKIVGKIAGVQKVYNVIALASPSSSLTKISDAWVTTKVKAKLIASEDVDDGGQIKVVTENGTVYLMGIVTPESAEAAVDLASNTAGVESVVKMFSYMHITKA